MIGSTVVVAALLVLTVRHYKKIINQMREQSIAHIRKIYDNMSEVPPGSEHQSIRRIHLDYMCADIDRHLNRWPWDKTYRPPEIKDAISLYFNIINDW